MSDLLQGIDLSTGLTLDGTAHAGDGGSLALFLHDGKSTQLTVVFYQTRIPENYIAPDNPTFFWVNDHAVPVRSEVEKQLLASLKTLHFNPEESAKTRGYILERISFIESEEYLRLVTKKGL